ncbi:CsgE family curli-type amyloid fiber assembly protein [Arundinibacter roseus]|uniref:Curli production assembly/transport component CsgE n=1 Tax=Arundinibacter roseus TaxID=2070510 RepID=A0A4R4K8M3_9BACT|nr:CsgE family curli-type amyloid fiber assembly protein [Arundinibacter roseus]TDB64054.1 hypothetical protein EZE20_14015 [Arundinibacter roseus]
MVNSKRLFLRLLFFTACLFTSGFCYAQSVEEAYDETAFVPVEISMQVESSAGFLLDNTRTKNGRDFYEFFYQQWLVVQTDTTYFSPDAIQNIGEELTITIDEQPAQGISSIVSLTVNDIMIWQQFLQPRLGVIELLAEDAAASLAQYVINFQEFQQQLGSDDQKGTGIF